MASHARKDELKPCSSRLPRTCLHSPKKGQKETESSFLTIFVCNMVDCLIYSVTMGAYINFPKIQTKVANPDELCLGPINLITFN